ncbi:MAG: vitamin K epoxide reductase family protein [Bacteroidetes bacterium]|nr:vitamin K epoxide reductase family protein [Bacteroidota bacterium]
MAKNTAVWLPRIIFGLALLGVFLVTDMYLQEAFGRGCFSPEAANELTCDEVFESGAGTFFGISNVLMGLLFYLVLAALRFGHAVVNPPRRETVRKASFALVTMGFLYSVYLTGYQFISPELKAVALCKLCLGSALTTTVLFILHIVEHRRTTTSTASRGSLALKPFIAMAALAAVLIVADVAYAKGMFGGEPASASEGATENTNDLALNGQETNPAAQIEITDPAMQCTYDPEYETLDGIEPSASDDEEWLSQRQEEVQRLGAFGDALAACLTPAGDDSAYRRLRTAASGLSVMLEASDQRIAGAASLWQAALFLNAGLADRALALLEPALAAPPTKHVRPAFFARLLRCRAIAEQQRYTTALALLFQLEERCEEWFPVEADRGDALRAVTIVEWQVLRDWHEALDGESHAPQRQWCADKATAFLQERFTDQARAILRLGRSVPLIAAVPDAAAPHAPRPVPKAPEKAQAAREGA